MSRYRAALVHLSISAVLVGCVLALVFWVWYPSPTIEVIGASSIVLLLIGVDLVIGPLLTLIIYKHGKPGLKFDLFVIAALQLSALVYGANRLYYEKPDYMVFVVDRLEFVSKNQLDQSAIRFDELRTNQFGKLLQVYAKAPEDPDEHSRYLDSVLVEGKPDLEARPEFWEPWSAGENEIRARLMPIENIEPGSPEEQKQVQDAIDTYASTHPSLGVLPIGGIEEDMGMLLDRDTLEVLDVLKADPWPADE